jgi:hypothetical protein
MTMADSPLAKYIARFKALPKQQRLGIVFAIPVVIAAAAGHATWGALAKLGPDEAVPRPLRRDTGTGKWNEINTTRSEIDAKMVVIAEKGAIQAKLESLQAEIAVAEERLPREAEKSMMREIIQRLARDVPADIGSVAIKSVAITEDSGRAAGSSSKGELRSMTFGLEIEGDINGIIKFIDSVEKNPRFMIVNSLSLRAGEVRTDPSARPPRPAFGLHSVRLELITYVYAKKGGK